MLFAKLLPKEGNFFEFFNQHARHTLEAAQALQNCVTNFDDAQLRAKYCRDVDDAEHSADSATHKTLQTLHKTFITPIDREQIHSLINNLDDVPDLIQDSAEAMMLYDLRHVTEGITRLTAIILRCCELLRDGVALLPKVSDPKVAEQAIKICIEISAQETEADHVLRSSMRSLFREEPDLRELIRLKAIYELLEGVTDKCEHVSNLIEGIVLENS